MVPASSVSGSAPAAAYAFPDDLLATLLAVSLTAVNLLRPVYGGEGGREIVDFHLDYLNPAAQRMAGLSEQPGLTIRGRFPETGPSGVFDFYRRTFESGEAGQFRVNYQADGLDNFFHFAARRCGEVLVVSFTDTADQPRTPVEEALRESQAAEQQARGDAEAQRQRLHEVLMQLPAQVAVHHGSEQVFTLVNPPYQRLAPGRPLLGLPSRAAWPELASQGILDVLDGVYQTGEPFIGTEVPLQVDFTRTSQPEQVYYNVTFVPLRDAQGRVNGVLDFSYDVSEQVRARRQVEQLNQELETRVRERTQEAEAARAEAERQRARLERFFMQAPAAICVHDGPELVFELVNPTFQRLFPGRELLSKALLAALPEVAALEAYRTTRRVYETGETFEARALLVPLLGADAKPEEHYFDLIQQPRFDEHGQVDGVLVFAFQVTEQVRARQHAATLQTELLAVAQHQAHEREAFYHVFEQTPALIALLRAPGHRFEYVNPAYQRLFPGRQLVGLDMVVAVPEMKEQRFVALLDHVYETGQTHFGTDTPFVVPAAAGQPARTAYFTFTYQAYQENGQTAGISIFAYEVTEQVLARQERETQRQQLAEVFAQAPAAICVFRGPDYVLDVVNPPMGEMLGRPLEQLVGRPFFEALPELTGQGLSDLLDAVRRTGTPYVAQEQRVQLARHGAGETGYFDFTYQPLRDAAGQVVAITCVAVEVTGQVEARQRVQSLNEELAAINEELQAANEELSDSNQQLVRTNVDLDNFIYTASHDLKAPITNIEGLLQALREHLPPAARQAKPVPELLAMMQGAVERFQLTIAQLSDITQLQQAHAQPAETIRLAALVEAVRLDLAPVLGAAGAELRVDVAACPTVSFSAKNLRSILYNLLSNAVKYRQPGRPPLVQLRAYPRPADQGPAGAVLEVEDNGLGLDEGQRAKLFGMFQRLHTHVEGSGIGLYMVKKIVDNAGGTISVASQPGVGSTFCVFLPGASRASGPQ